MFLIKRTPATISVMVAGAGSLNPRSFSRFFQEVVGSIIWCGKQKFLLRSRDLFPSLFDIPAMSCCNGLDCLL